MALGSREGEGGTYVVIPGVIKPYSSQDEHGQEDEGTTEAHWIGVSEGRV